MLGICVRLGWYGLGRHDDLFTRWLDLGVIGFGWTPLIAKAQVDEVARRFRLIKNTLPALAGKVRK
jgi:hypothetical protein